MDRDAYRKTYITFEHQPSPGDIKLTDLVNGVSGDEPRIVEDLQDRQELSTLHDFMQAQTNYHSLRANNFEEKIMRGTAPPSIPKYVGRQKELAELNDHLDRDYPLRMGDIDRRYRTGQVMTALTWQGQRRQHGSRHPAAS